MTEECWIMRYKGESAISINHKSYYPTAQISSLTGILYYYCHFIFVKNIIPVRFQVLKAVTVRSTVLWDVTLFYVVEVCQHFGVSKQKFAIHVQI
jgi:hypothetical protein